MAPPLARFFVSTILFCASNALLPDLPHQTSTSDEAFDPRGWSPRPTDNPSHHPYNIFARQNFPNFPGDAEKILVAPDNTCGYISGLQGAPFSCSSKYKCLFFSATGDDYGPVACCTTGMSCKIRTACVASTDYYGSQSDSACNAGCRMDLYTLKCTDASEPYCGGVRFTSPNIQDFWCVESPAASWHSGATTYKNQPQRVFTTVDKSDLWPVSTSTSTSTSSGQSSTLSTESSSQTSDDSTKPPSSAPTAAAAPVGAIVGGVLGGIALIAIVGFGAFILWRRYKKKDHYELSGGGINPDPYTSYRGASEMDANARNSYMMTTPAGGNQTYYDPPKPQELYTSPLKPQELYAPPTGGAKTGQYTQVPNDDGGGGGYYHQGGNQQPSELESRQYNATSPPPGYGR